jgi:hypothetical protein
MKTQYIPTTKINQLKPFMELFTVYYENHKKHENTLCGQNAEFFYVTIGGTHSNHWAVMG